MLGVLGGKDTTGGCVERSVGNGKRTGKRASGENLSADGPNVTVSATPNRSRLEVVVCIYYRDRMEGESEGEEREFGGPGRGGHNRASSLLGEEAWDIGQGVCGGRRG